MSETRNKACLVFLLWAMVPCATSRADLTSADSAPFALNTESFVSLPTFADSAAFSVNTSLALATPVFADSPAFNLNTTLVTTAPAFADSGVAPLNLRRINRAWGDSESFSLNIPFAAPTLNSATPQCNGITPGILLAWTAALGATRYEIYRNNMLIFTTQTAGTTFWNIGGLSAGQGYVYRIRARFGSQVSELSNPVSAIAPMCAPQPPAEHQPPHVPHQAPSITVQLNRLWKWDNNLNQFVAPPSTGQTLDPTKPTYILAHGWDSDLNGDTCLFQAFAMSSIGCVIRLARPDANILAWDWHEAANPNYPICDVPDGLVANVLAQLATTGSVTPFFAVPTLLDAVISGVNAGKEGNILGKALADQMVLHQGSLGSELHFIGHSHGGGVLGAAAQVMKQLESQGYGHAPDTLTTLDTPKCGCLPFLGCAVDSTKYIRADSVRQGGRVAAFYFGSYHARLRGGVGGPVAGGGDMLTNVELNPSHVPGVLPTAHTWIHGQDDRVCAPQINAVPGWFPGSVFDAILNGPHFLVFNKMNVITVADSVLSVGQFPPGCYVEDTQYHFTGGDCEEPRSGGGNESETPGLALLTDEPFTTAVSWSSNTAQLVVGADPNDPANRVILMTEDGDVSFFKDIAWPARSLEMTFDYMFREPRGQESLTVYLNDQIVYYDNAQTTLAMGGLRSSGAIWVGQAAGTTARLNFVLRSDGISGGSLVLDNVRTFGLIAGDMTGDGHVDGEDVQPFVTAVFAASTDPADLYIADFNASGVIDAGDVPVFVQALLG